MTVVPNDDKIKANILDRIKSKNYHIVLLFRDVIIPMPMCK